MNDSYLPEVVPQGAVDIAPVSIEGMKRQMLAIQQVMSEVMIKDVHYGKIPGTDKNTLLKGGAEKICLLFRLSPTFESEIMEFAGGHREYRIKCSLLSNGQVVAQGLASCSTMESKYRWRLAKRKCPACGNTESLKKSKPEYGGGFYCYDKAGGCGAKYDGNDPAIVSQKVGKIENPDIADTYNTVLKMATKRAHVAAVITGTAASDIFNQDLEELSEEAKADLAKKAQRKPPAPTKAAPIPEDDDIPNWGYGDDSDDPEPEPKPYKYSEPAPAPSGEWTAYKYRYHIPPEKREPLKKAGYRFNGEDKHWYGNNPVPELSEYLRPLN